MQGSTYIHIYIRKERLRQWRSLSFVVVSKGMFLLAVVFVHDLDEFYNFVAVANLIVIP
jgi:hypothetical protein